jgi:hypothetical protein
VLLTVFLLCLQFLIIALQYIIANLGFSTNFVANIEFELLTFPAHLSIDWIRVYQPKGSVNIGCDPVDHPTAAYIET